jgi:hypothetical protein
MEDIRKWPCIRHRHSWEDNITILWNIVAGVLDCVHLAKDPW